MTHNGVPLRSSHASPNPERRGCRGPDAADTAETKSALLPLEHRAPQTTRISKGKGTPAFGRDANTNAPGTHP